MNIFPTFYRLQNRQVVIVGGGENAARKARLVLSAGAKLTLISSTFDSSVRREFAGKCVLTERGVEKADLLEAALVIIAEEGEAGASAFQTAKSAGRPLNVVDRPDLSDFIMPAIIDRGDVVVGISTNGTAPVFGRRLREKIENWLPKKTDQLVSFAQSFRHLVAEKILPENRRGFWEDFFDGPISAAVLEGREADARHAMHRTIENPKKEEIGVVHIVGAGPGDPELLTIKAHRLLQAADVILYDRLVGDSILELARRDAIRVYVGKAKSNHSVEQGEIEDRLIEYARSGKTVVRLKGGDPFIFGRGGEELAAVKAAGVPVYVTPGITAAIGCAASAGMALTHRDHAQAITFVTGHAKGNGEPDINWSALAQLKQTIAIYMGVGTAPLIMRRLLEAGREPETPIAVIENGSRDNEVVVKGQLSRLGSVIKSSGILGPAILVIGEIASLADECDLRAVALGKEAA